MRGDSTNDPVMIEPAMGSVASSSDSAGAMALVPGIPLSESRRTNAPSPEFLARVSHDFARRHLILSRGTLEGKEILHVADRAKPAAIHNVRVALSREVLTELHPAEAIAAAIDHAYAAEEARTGTTGVDAAERDGPPVEVQGSADVEADLKVVLAQADADLLSTEGKGPIVRLVDLLLFGALQRSASDVHVQPVADRVLVRYRLDGVLVTVRELPLNMLAAIVSRVKIMARLDVAEQRMPQDGRATVTLGAVKSLGSREAVLREASRRIDLRVSTLPTTYGERVVIRILDTSKSPHLLNFTALGMPSAVETRFLQQCARTSGVVLVTGPTGSGKTTTLYTTLAWVTAHNSGNSRQPSSQAATCELNIMTIEDPVEYDLATAGLAISQTQLNSKKQMTFAAGLRHILRQDPDVIMVGEIRDEETARVAVQASLTGHLVLSTLHTNDAAGAVARLLDLGIEPFLVSSSLAAVLAQRLVRKVHIPCTGTGCEDCLHTGYQGRMGIFELLVLDEDLRGMVSQRAGASVIKQAAVHKGMVTLRDAGLDQAKLGRTNLAEVTRVIEGLE